ncbi:MAG TPA: hypothetical protein PKD37_01030 [Oligoflexia bacterium]|nr:hypothetical protein [Oligoflexia bacterium]HMP26562.1 hypothetical protein [Oligoflexia bacterium]
MTDIIERLKPADFGPIYAETNLSRFPVEPFNAISNLIFLLIIIWLIKETKFNFKKHPLLTISIPLFFVGFIGGTIFHATRSANIWLILDFTPIFLLSALAAYDLWRTIISSKLMAFLIAIAPLFIARFVHALLEVPMLIKAVLGYGSLAVIILLPSIIVASRLGRKNILQVVAATFLFLIAIIFRSLDSEKILPMGTHFLWHIFGGLSVWALLLVVKERDQRSELIKKTS